MAEIPFFDYLFDDYCPCETEFIESGETINPLYGSRLSNKEYEEIVMRVKTEAVFFTDYGQKNSMDLFCIYIPVSRILLLSAGIDQELAYFWGGPCEIHWCKQYKFEYTCYAFYLPETYRHLHSKRLKKSQMDIFMNEFYKTFGWTKQ